MVNVMNNPDKHSNIAAARELAYPHQIFQLEIASEFPHSGSLLANRAVVELGEKIIALVIHEDERRKILHRDFPNGFHTELGKCDHFLGFDVVLRE